MTARSWRVVEPDPPEHALPVDLAARDPLGGRDCGWVNQMRPFVREFCPPGGTVFDPFCGFGTTLLAAALEGRVATGTEIDPARARLARERLARHGIDGGAVRDGSIAQLPADARFDLVLTSVPYFGCAPIGDAVAGQLYGAAAYADWLHGLRDVFHALRPHVRDGGHVVATCENVRIGGRVFAQAFDVARILGSLYVACDERVLCYPPRASEACPDPGATDRTHEYALVFRHVEARIDLAATQALLADLHAAGFDFDVHGSFAAWQRDPATSPEPHDLDLHLPRDQAALERLLAWLRARGFELALWGEPVAFPPDLATLARHHYLRGERRDRAGGLVRVDLSLRVAHSR